MNRYQADERSARPVGGPIGSLALVRVNFEHMGISRLTSGGRTFLFRHYQTEQVNPIVWNAIFDARYRLPSGPLVLTPVAAPAGQVGFRFASEPGTRYTIEQTTRLTNPVWTPLETRIGDGSLIQFTRPTGTNPAVFFRLRVD